jgi:hypothetical protein
MIETSSRPASPQPTQQLTNNQHSEHNKQEGLMFNRRVLFVGVLVMMLTASPAWAQLDQSFGQEGTVILDDEQLLIPWAAAHLPDGSIAVGGAIGDSSESEENLTPWLTVVSPDGAMVSEIDLGALADDIVAIVGVASLGDRLLVVARTVLGDDCSTVIASLALDGSPDAGFGQSGFVTIASCLAAQQAVVTKDVIRLIGGFTDDSGTFHRVATIALDGSSVDLDGVLPGAIPGGALVGSDGNPILIDYVERPDGWWLQTTRLDGTEIDRAFIGVMSGGFGVFPTAHGYLGYISVRASTVLPYLIDPSGAIEVFAPIVPHTPSATTGPWATAYDRLGRVVLFSGAPTSVSIDLVDITGRLIEPVGETGTSGDFNFPAAALLDHRSGSMVVVGAETVGDFAGGDVLIARYLLDDSGRFIDDDASVHQTDIETIASTGVTRGCNPPLDTQFCPTDPVTRGQMASFLVRALDLAPADDSPFTDTAGSVHTADIDALAQAGITTGCTADRYCPEDPVTRGQMASFLVRALDLAPADDSPFTDTDGSVHAADIAALAQAGITLGCTAGEYCPADPVTRAQMASFLVRALAQAR